MSVVLCRIKEEVEFYIWVDAMWNRVSVTRQHGVWLLVTMYIRNAKICGGEK